MSTAIKATNSKGLTIENCKFDGFDTDIELENVEGFISKNNQFSRQNDPRILLDLLFQELRLSKLDKSSKDRIAKQIINALSSKNTLQAEESKIKTVLKIAGNKAIDLFVQLSAAVAAGLIIK